MSLHPIVHAGTCSSLGTKQRSTRFAYALGLCFLRKRKLRDRAPANAREPSFNILYLKLDGLYSVVGGDSDTEVDLKALSTAPLYICNFSGLAELRCLPSATAPVVRGYLGHGERK